MITFKNTMGTIVSVNVDHIVYAKANADGVLLYMDDSSVHTMAGYSMREFLEMTDEGLSGKSRQRSIAAA